MCMNQGYYNNDFVGEDFGGYNKGYGNNNEFGGYGGYGGCNSCNGAIGFNGNNAYCTAGCYNEGYNNGYRRGYQQATRRPNCCYYNY